MISLTKSSSKTRIFGLALAATLPLPLSSAELTYVDYYNYAPGAAIAQQDGYAKLSIPHIDGLGWYVNGPKKVSYCDKSSSIRCVEFGPLNLSVPSSVAKGKTWTLGARTFRAISLSEVQIFGQKVAVFRIEAKTDHDSYHYLYSPELGVVAVIWPADSGYESGDVYLLGSKKGVLAPTN